MLETYRRWLHDDLHVIGDAHQAFVGLDGEHVTGQRRWVVRTFRPLRWSYCPGFQAGSRTSTADSIVPVTPAGFSQLTESMVCHFSRRLRLERVFRPKKNRPNSLLRSRHRLQR